MKGSISEKWFYTHIKHEQEKLPRIDVLNLLAEYVGFRNWQAFVATLEQGNEEHETQVTVPVEQHFADPEPSVSIETAVLPSEKSVPVTQNAVSAAPENASSGKRLVIGSLFLIAALSVISILYFSQTKMTTQCSFCFPDCPETILAEQILDGQSPIQYRSDSSDCITFASAASVLRLRVSAPYHVTDTIVRNLQGGTHQESIHLRKDDFAMMIQYFAESAPGDLSKRNTQLKKAIQTTARIFQVTEDQRGVELMNQEEFIAYLLSPVQSKKRMKILETQYDAGKISYLRFTIQSVKP